MELSSTCTALVSDVKREVQARTGIPVEQQQLMFKGRVMANGSTLKSCGVLCGSKITLTVVDAEFPIELKVAMPTGGVQVVYLKWYQLVRDVKREVQARTGIPVEQQQLVFKGRVMANGSTL
ncbi:hypothetical protein B484DRAFT_338056, partial [Ochromonadaceae sp. CCMP2298]